MIDDMFPDDLRHQSVERSTGRDDQIYEIDAGAIAQDGTFECIGLPANASRSLKELFLFARGRAPAQTRCGYCLSRSSQ
jgi:hypothetical protein